MKRFFLSGHKPAFWGLAVLSALALGAVTENRAEDFQTSQDYPTRFREPGTGIEVWLPGTSPTEKPHEEKHDRPRNSAGSRASGRDDRQRRRLETLDYVGYFHLAVEGLRKKERAAAKNPPSGVSGGGPDQKRPVTQHSSLDSRVSPVSLGVTIDQHGLALKSQKQKEAGRVLVTFDPAWPLLVSISGGKRG